VVLPTNLSGEARRAAKRFLDLVDRLAPRSGSQAAPLVSSMHGRTERDGVAAEIVGLRLG